MRMWDLQPVMPRCDRSHRSKPSPGEQVAARPRPSWPVWGGASKAWRPEGAFVSCRRGSPACMIGLLCLFMLIRMEQGAPPGAQAARARAGAGGRATGGGRLEPEG